MRSRRWSPSRMACVCAAVALGLAEAEGRTVEVGPEDHIDAVEQAFNSLRPGDQLVLRGGTYTLGGRFSFEAIGTPSEPIVIRAKEGERPHFFRPNASQNIIDIENAEHVELRGIEFSGGSAGVRISGATHLTIAQCEIHDTGDVALRANDSGVTYDSLRIVGNHIHHTNHTGEGMYLGCNYDGCRVRNSLVVGNYVHHTNQPSVTQGDGIELKEGSHDNVIADNVIHDTNYPCILTYSAVGNGGPNVVERNVMWGCGDNAIQSAADATIRNNIVLGAGASGIAVQPHQSGAPDNLAIVHNTIIKATGTAIAVRGAAGDVLVANNAVYALDRALLVSGGNVAGVDIGDNVGSGRVSGTGALIPGDIDVDLVAAHYLGSPPVDVFPAAGGALVGRARELGDGDVADDFNRTSRAGSNDVGAYRHDPGGNPGWPLSGSFKAFPPPVAPDPHAELLHVLELLLDD